MARAETQELVVDLRLRDQLSGPLGAAKGQLGGIDTAAAKAGTSLGNLAKAGIGAFAAFKAADVVSDFFASGIKGAIAEEAGISRLTASLKANVPAWDGSTAAIERTIKARQALGFADDEQRDALARAVAATNDEAKAQSIVATAMDLARFKGIDLAAATDALVKIEGGQFRALKALGIELKDGATQTQALAAVQAVAAGQAAKYGKDTAGALAEAGIAIDNLKEDLAAGLLPVIGDGARLITHDFIPTLKLAVKGIGEVADEALHAVPPVGAFFDAIESGSHDAGLSILDLLPLGPQLRQTYATLGDAALAAAEAEAQQASEIDRARQAMINAIITAREAAGQTEDTAQEINDLGLTAQATALYISRDLTASLNAIPRDIEVNIKLRTDVGLGVNERIAAAGDPSNITNIAQANLDFLAGQKEREAQLAADRKAARDRAAREAEQAANERLAAAKRRAQEEARAYEKALDTAFDNAKRTANSLFDTLHDRHVQAIRDAETLAERQHRGALQVISDTLKAQQLANAAPVTAAEAALNARQQAQGRRGLVESLQGAQAALQANRDPKAAEDLARSLRNATEALENFDAAAQIGRLSEVQRTQDAKAQAVADDASLRADAALTAAKAQAQKDLDAETVAAAKRRKDFDAALQRLQAADVKAKRSPAEVKADIDKLGERFGITTDKFGRHHIEDPLERAIKSIKIEPPIVNLAPIFNAVFRVGARDLAAALVSQTQPSQTATVRTGAGGRT